jgi:hypothetical protein
MIDVRSPDIAASFPANAPLVGLSTAREYYVDGWAEPQHMGVNALFIPFAYCRDENGMLIRKVVITIRAPIGSMAETSAMMQAFMRRHLLMR